jgi:hypothetical protein
METAIEEVIENGEEGLYEKSILLDDRIQIFEYLSKHKDSSISSREILENIITDKKIRSIPYLMNLLIHYDLISYDFITHTYKFRETERSKSVEKTIDKIRAS